MIKAKRVLIIQKNLSNVTDHFLRKTSLQCSCLFILYEFWSVTVTETQVKICPSPVQPRENIQIPIPTSEKISLHLSRSLQIPGQMRPFLWRATRGHSSSGGHNTPFHRGLALKFHRWWEERRTLDPPSPLQCNTSAWGSGNVAAAWRKRKNAECGALTQYLLTVLRALFQGLKMQIVNNLWWNRDVWHIRGGSIAPLIKCKPHPTYGF